MDNNNSNNNTYRVAIASTDGYTVDTHFGRSNTFYIYQRYDNEWIFVEKRTVAPTCNNGKHSIEEMNKNILLFNDCKYIVASKIGTGASTAIQSQNIIPMSLPGDINDALEKIYTYNEIQNLFNV